MQILTINPQLVVSGRLSDGSDRAESYVYNVTVKDGFRTFTHTFESEPDEAVITSAYLAGAFTDVTPESEILKNQMELMQAAIDDLILGGAL